MSSELFTICGSCKTASTSGTCSGAPTAVTGNFNLASPIFTDISGSAAWISGSAPTTIVIPKGTVLKIWEEKLTVHQGTVNANIDVSHNSGTTYQTISTNTVTGSSGSNQISIRRTGRPLVIPSDNGTSGYTNVRFTYDLSAATGGATAQYVAEIVELHE